MSTRIFYCYPDFIDVYDTNSEFQLLEQGNYFISYTTVPCELYRWDHCVEEPDVIYGLLDSTLLVHLLLSSRKKTNTFCKKVWRWLSNDQT